MTGVTGVTGVKGLTGETRVTGASKEGEGQRGGGEGEDITMAGQRPNKERYSYSANGCWKAEMRNF